MLSITARDTSRAGEGTHQERCLVELRRREGPDATPSRVSTWQRRCCSRLAGIRCQAAHERSGSCRCRCRVVSCRLLPLIDMMLMLNRCEQKGNQPIHCASISGLSDVISILLSMGASLGARNLVCSLALARYRLISLVNSCVFASTHPSIHPTTGWRYSSARSCLSRQELRVHVQSADRKPRRHRGHQPRTTASASSSLSSSSLSSLGFNGVRCSYHPCVARRDSTLSSMLQGFDGGLVSDREQGEHHAMGRGMHHSRHPGECPMYARRYSLAFG